MKRTRNAKAKQTDNGKSGSLAEGVAVAAAANGGARPWPVEHVERWPIDKLVPYVRNPKQHPPEQVDLIAKSMARFGQAQVILIDEAGEIIAGHGRVLAAQKLGWPSLMVGQARGWNEDEKRAYRIADNELGGTRLAPWNMDLLRVELRELSLAQFEMPLLGFDAKHLQWLQSERIAGDIDPDSIPDPPPEAISILGDRWMAGDHVVLCGDASDTEQVGKLVGDAQIHLINTDPPYNVRVEPRSNNAIAAGLSSFGSFGNHQNFDFKRFPGKSKKTGAMRAKDRPLKNDFMPDDKFDQLLGVWFANMAARLIPGGSFYIWGGYSNWKNYPSKIESAGLYFSQGIAWVKEHPVLTRKDYMGNFESCFYGWKEGGPHRWFGPTNATDVWPIKKINPQAMVHLTEKPVELAARAITYSSDIGENVLDVFGGSGSTLIGAEQVGGRSAYLMEIDPLYCDIILMRWQNFTGKKATLDGDGRDFDAIKAERLKQKPKRKGRHKDGPSVSETSEVQA